MFWQIDVVGNLMVIGQDNESADMVNPQGLLYGERFVIIAEGPDGARKELIDLIFADRDEAGRFAHTLDGESPNGQDWLDMRPAYGSSAYVDGDWPSQDWMNERTAEHDRTGLIYDL